MISGLDLFIINIIVVVGFLAVFLGIGEWLNQKWGEKWAMWWLWIPGIIYLIIMVGKI